MKTLCAIAKVIVITTLILAATMLAAWIFCGCGTFEPAQVEWRERDPTPW